MRIRQLHRRTVLPVDPETAFAFFCDPANLQRITPPELDFTIVDPPLGAIGHGVEIGYRLRLFGVPFQWRSQIIDWRPGREFVDTAIESPYHSWHHRHVIVPDEAGTAVFDLVDYALPLWPIGELAGGVVGRQLDRIFDFREETIQAIFGAPAVIDALQASQSADAA